MYLVTEMHGRHHEVVPHTAELRVGTLATILKSIAAHHKLSVRDLVQFLEL
jgi:hypothetical protein